MKKYIQQLLSDIRNSGIEPEPFDFPGRNRSGGAFDDDDEDFMAAHLRQLDDYVAGRGEMRPLVQILGLTPEAFPPAEKLENPEMAAIISAVLESLSTHGITLELPGDAPPKFNYQILLDVLGRETMVPTPGIGSFIHIDFCTGSPDGCALKGYCPCLKNPSGDLEMDGPDDDGPWQGFRPSKPADKVFKAMLKAGEMGRKGGKFTVSIKKRDETLSKKAKPIHKWLKIDMDIFGDFHRWGTRDCDLVMGSIQMAFPKMDWSWLEYTDSCDAFDMTTGLLEVRADFDKKGGFSTTRREIFWFLQLGDRMRHKREFGDSELPF